jgi:hypothetical protein
MDLQLLDHIRPLVPAALKRPVRQLLESWETSRRSRALQRAVAALRREVQAGAISPALWPELREAWGNTAFSADAGYLAEIAARALARRGPVLECGSGLSTLVLGVIADTRQARVWSLEQDGEWLRLVSGMLAQFAVRRVALWHTPLVLRGDYAWFDLAGRDLPRAFLHVFCDGPAVLSHWPAPIHLAWRRGVVPELLQLGIGFDEIVLDDADDPRCGALCEYWSQLGVTTRVVQTASGPFVIGRHVPT